MASTVGKERAGNETYQNDHLSLIFRDGFSFSGFERDLLSLNLQGDRFKDISGVSGIDSILDGRAAVLADFDNDGDLDVFLTTIQGEGHLLFRNNVGQRNEFLRIALEGTRSGKDAFGTIVRLKTSQGVQTRIKSGGNGFLAQHDPRLLFGLGNDKEVASVEIVWPSGQVQKIEALKAGTSVKVIENRSEHQVVRERITQLPDPISREERFWAKLKIRKNGEFPKLKLISVQNGGEPDNNLLRPGISYFLNLWATWCGPCRKEMPELQKLLPEFEANEIQLIGVSLDQDMRPDQVKAFADQLGISYPVYMIQEGDLQGIFAEEIFVPLSIFVDERGRVRDIFAGWSAQSERRIHDLLNRRQNRSQ